MKAITDARVELTEQDIRRRFVEVVNFTASVLRMPSIATESRREFYATQIEAHEHIAEAMGWHDIHEAMGVVLDAIADARRASWSGSERAKIPELEQVDNKDEYFIKGAPK